MPRTTAELVATVVSELNPDVDLDAFILSANELVTEVCSDAGYTDARLELIERWLAGHFYRIYDPALESEMAEMVGGKYFGKVGLQLLQTREGQQALLLDTAGGLAKLSKDTAEGTRNATFGVHYVGKTPETRERA